VHCSIVLALAGLLFYFSVPLALYSCGKSLSGLLLITSIPYKSHRFIYINCPNWGSKLFDEIYYWNFNFLMIAQKCPSSIRWQNSILYIGIVIFDGYVTFTLILMAYLSQIQIIIFEKGSKIR
jgi:hypothetical protein